MDKNLVISVTSRKHEPVRQYALYRDDAHLSWGYLTRGHEPVVSELL
jgi:hypothetical protein